MNITIPSTPVQQISCDITEKSGVKLYIKREDLNHPYISGNKLRKLKYNLLKAQNEGYDQLLTFGGAYSNHIYATAAAGAEYNFKTIGVVRGELHLPLNPTLRFSTENGMKLHYLNRSMYRHKYHPDILNLLKNKFGQFYLLPEGGSNELAIDGTREIINDLRQGFDIICTSSGTGGTLAGIIAGLNGEKTAFGFSALKGGGFLNEEVKKLLSNSNVPVFNNWKIVTDYHFGGYARYNRELVAFINQFKKDHQIQLDPIYTGKMLFGILDMIKRQQIEKGCRIMAIHTGGIQGIEGFNERFGNIID